MVAQPLRRWLCELALLVFFVGTLWGQTGSGDGAASQGQPSQTQPAHSQPAAGDDAHSGS